jgi:NAD(P)-dependent dehydrogenase (short-subunit alcohol dehydrogenase family)
MESAGYGSRFAGKTVIVTGAGSGIGLATATRLAHEGGKVVGTDLVEQRLADLAAGLRDFDVVTVTGDVAAAETTAAIVAAADGRVDGLANVAGIMDAFLPPAEVDDATWERVFSVNLTGPMRLTRAVLPLMLAAGAGTIVNVASEASLRASASGAAYTSSKHALVGFTKSVASFYGPQGIRPMPWHPVPLPRTSRPRGSLTSRPAGSGQSCKPPWARLRSRPSWQQPLPGC